MKKLSFLLVLLCIFSSATFAQIGFNTDNSQPHHSAGLDVNFPNKGVLIPRVALIATNAAGPISGPETSLLVYNTATAGTSPINVIPGFYYWNGSAWVRLSTVSGGTGTANYVTKWTAAGALSNSLLFDNGTNVGIWTTEPRSALNVANGGIAIGGGNGVSTIHGAKRSLQILTDNNYGGDYDNHSGYLVYSTMPTGWENATLNFAVSTNWGIYNTASPTLTMKGYNVGIGTTSPSAPLHVKASGSANPDQNGLIVLNPENSSGQDAINCLRVGGSSAGDPFISLDISGETGWSMGVDNSDDNSLKFSNAWDNLASATKMTLLTNGNVGIGTTSPSEKLTISTGVGTDVKASIIAGGEGQSSTLFLGTPFEGLLTNAFKTAIIAEGMNSYCRAKLHFCLDNSESNDKTNDASVSDAKMTIQADGNVGIGTTSPSEKLTISTGISTDVKTSIVAGGEAQKSILYLGTPYEGLLTNAFKTAILAEGINNFSRAKLHFCLNNTESNDKNNDASVTDAKMTILANGNVGIGTTNPLYPLEVVGSQSYSGYYSYGYLAFDGGTGHVTNGSGQISIWASQKINAAEFNATSDRRIKDIIGISDSRRDLDLIKRLEVTQYQYTDRIQHGNRIKQGFIAQQVEEVIPEAVSLNKDFVPDIYSVPVMAEYDAGQNELRIGLEKAHGLAVGDLVRVFAGKIKEEKTVSEITSENEFVLSDWNGSTDSLFVYGKQVDDFLTLDYDRIFTVGIGAIQELAKQLNEARAIIDSLEKERTEMQAQIDRINEYLEITSQK